MKKLLMAAGLLGMMGTAWAVNPDTLLIRVTPVAVKSVNVVEAEYNFGNQDLAASTMSLTGVTINNDGGIANTYALHVDRTGGTGTSWTLAGAAAVDTFALFALFNTAQPALLADFQANDALTEAAVTATAAAGGVFRGDLTGVGVSPVAGNDDRTLWLRLDMPTQLTSGTLSEQQFNLVVTAQ